MNRGMFDEVAGLDTFEKRSGVEKVIIHGVLLARPRLARRAGDGASHVRPRREQLLAKRRLAAARRRGNNNQQRTSNCGWPCRALGPRLSALIIPRSAPARGISPAPLSGSRLRAR